MNKLSNTAFLIMLLLAPSSIFAMDDETVSQPSVVTIQTSDKKKFTLDWEVANTSNTLKNKIENLGETEDAIPLPKISGLQFEVLLSAMNRFVKLHQTEEWQEEVDKLDKLGPTLKKINQRRLANQNTQTDIENLSTNERLKERAKETKINLEGLRIAWEVESQLEEYNATLAEKLKKIVAHLKSNNHPLNNKQLIEFIIGANYLDIPFVEPALEALTQRMLSAGEWLQLESLGDNLKDLWQMHPAKELLPREASLPHHNVTGVNVSSEGKNLISWSTKESTIKIWDRNNLDAEPVILAHKEVWDVINSMDGKNLISWSYDEGSIQLWDMNNLAAEPITLKHPGLGGVIESMDGKNLISWGGDIIKVWYKNNLDAPITLGHPGVYAVTEIDDGDYIISKSFKDNIRLRWDRSNHWAAQPVTYKHESSSSYFRPKDHPKHLKLSWTQDKGIIEVRNRNYLTIKPISLKHFKVEDVSKSLDGKHIISCSTEEGTIKVWDMAFLNPSPEQILLLLAVYFVSEDDEAFVPTPQAVAKLSFAFDDLPQIAQSKLQKKAPQFITRVKNLANLTCPTDLD